ncbi:MAG: PIG-L family deacetylase, partial [Geminicoccaceae bacterium]
MQARNPYRAMTSTYARLLRDGAALPLGGLAPPERPRLAANAPKALIFSPHPDDECIVGALPLRLRRELGMNIVDVAVTLGSRKERQAERRRELEGACAYIDFRLLATVENGLEHINKETRERKPELWAAAVEVIAEILRREQPQIIL